MPALWHAGHGVSVFAGALQRNAAHSHSVPVLLAGVYGSFDLRLGNGGWRRCRAAVVPAALPYAFDMHGDPLAVVYLEPSLARVDALAALIDGGSECHGALLGQCSTLGLLRDLFEDQGSARWAGEALHDLVRRAGARARRAIDPRIGLALARLQRDGGAAGAVAHAAEEAGLSVSRFQHLFSAEAGVPYRRYRAWQRMLTAIRDVVAGSTLTAAAHAAGYADQAHFAHDFRRMFGAPASPSLGNVRG